LVRIQKEGLLYRLVYIQKDGQVYRSGNRRIGYTRSPQIRIQKEGVIYRSEIEKHAATL
jgi:hypothetical protein